MPARPCECPTYEEALARGCKRSGQVPMTPMEYDLCSGNCKLANPCNAAISNAYRERWDGLTPAAHLPRCPFLWKRVRDQEGKIEQRKCGTCPGMPPFDVFECRCPARRQPSGQNDHVTLLDCQTCLYRPKPVETEARKLTLKNHLSPGDVACMTAAVYSLHKKNPGKFLIAVDTTAPALWEHNPDVVPHGEGFEVVQTHYPLVNSSNQVAVHQLHGYCQFLEDNLRVEVPLATNRPRLYLSAAEKGWINQVQETTGRKQRYWLVCAGRKDDYTAKFAGTEFYQRLVNLLRGKVFFVQIGAKEHHHPPLKGVLNLVGKTDLRQLVRLAYHAEGGVGGTTLLMHLMAAWEKPYICLLGGREPVPWNAYPKTHLLHTIGLLPCCRESACWKSRTVKLGDGKVQDESLCVDPLLGDEPVPRCLALLRPEEAAERITLTANAGSS